jgi:hypothetical protein
MPIDCYCDYEETCDFYFERYQNARKVHTCCDCGGKIGVGERYLVHGGGYAGDFHVAKRCADCDFMQSEVGRTLLQHCFGWGCIIIGDMPQSWESLCEGNEEATEQEREQMRRIVGMQHAVCDARGGNRKWQLPSYAEAGEAGEAGERGAE